MNARPSVLVLLSAAIRPTYIAAEDVARLERFADCRVIEVEDGSPLEPVVEEIERADAVVVCHGAPRISDALLAQAPRLKLVGELEGDRFAQRIDVDAATARGVAVVDTTQGSSYPVSEWALALMMMALRNAGWYYRRLISGEVVRQQREDFGYIHGELTGKRVGLLGCGHIGRRLIELLRPFRADVRVFDPYIPNEIVDTLEVLRSSLDYVLSSSDVVVCLLPLTPKTRGLLGTAELNKIPSGTAFVNVSRGPVVDSAALIERLGRGDVTAALDVFDPEPIPQESPIRTLPNVFLSPHVAGVTAASRPRFFHLMVDELDRFFHGHATRYNLDRRALANRRGEEPPLA